MSIGLTVTYEYRACDEFCNGCSHWQLEFVESSSGALRGAIKRCSMLHYDDLGRTIYKYHIRKVPFEPYERGRYDGYECIYNRFRQLSDVDSSKLKTTDE